MTSLTRALLITYPGEYVREEAADLAEAAGYEPVAVVTQGYLGRAKYGVGSGKAEEVARLARENDVHSIIFDSALNPTQMYNLAKLCKVEVKDREKVILEIFAKRASTAEAKIQVELAELAYELPRARNKVRMAKQGEQPGFFGLGKYEVDVYVRMMKRRIGTLRAKAEEVRNRRVIFRQRRERTQFPTIVLTGYTGSGKTTLFNRLAGETKQVDAGVFTTLSPTIRGILVGNRKVLVSDTVGFISRLPTYMIEAFKSTLEEISYSTLVLLLIDSSQPDEKLARNYSSCVETLAELGVPDSRALIVMNKVDLVTSEELGEKAWALRLRNYAGVSAKTGAGLDQLLEAVEKRLGGDARADVEHGLESRAS